MAVPNFPKVSACGFADQNEKDGGSHLCWVERKRAKGFLQETDSNPMHIFI